MKAMRDVIAAEIGQLVTAFGGNPEAIAENRCEDFAETLLMKLSRKGVRRAIVVDDAWFRSDVLGGDALHSWVYVDGLHYDPEVPQGLADWTKLPFFQRKRRLSRGKGYTFGDDIVRIDDVETERERLESDLDSLSMALGVAQSTDTRFKFLSLDFSLDRGRPHGAATALAAPRRTADDARSGDRIVGGTVCVFP